MSIDAYRRQQGRWATGSFQSAFKLLIPVLRSRNRAGVKLQASVHLLSYGIGPLMLMQLICYPALLITLGRHGLPWPLADAAVFVVPVAVVRLHRRANKAGTPVVVGAPVSFLPGRRCRDVADRDARALAGHQARGKV